MVKSSSSQPPSSCSPPFAFLSLVSNPLKPCKQSPVFSFLKRPPLAHRQAMDPSYSPSSTSTSDCLKNSSTIDKISFPMEDRQQPRKFAETPPSSVEKAVAVTDKQGCMCGQQRLQQHRVQMSGKVIIPETWGYEQQLQEWVGYGIIEDALRPAGLSSARIALVRERQHREKEPARASPVMSADVQVS